MLGFAAGVMTAASVWSLLLPAIEQAADFGVPGWLPAAAGLLLGVCFLSALDAALPHLRRQRDADLTRRQSTLLMAAITLHNVPEGMAVGLAFALAEAGEGHGRVPPHWPWELESRISRRARLSLCRCGRRGIPGGRSFALGTLSGAVEPRRESWQRWRRPECGR